MNTNFLSSSHPQFGGLSKSKNAGAIVALTAVLTGGGGAAALASTPADTGSTRVTSDTTSFNFKNSATQADLTSGSVDCQALKQQLAGQFDITSKLLKDSGVPDSQLTEMKNTFSLSINQLMSPDTKPEAVQKNFRAFTDSIWNAATALPQLSSAQLTQLRETLDTINSQADFQNELVAESQVTIQKNACDTGSALSESAKKEGKKKLDNNSNTRLLLGILSALGLGGIIAGVGIAANKNGGASRRK